MRNRGFEQEISVRLLLGPGLVRCQAKVRQLENLVLLKPQNHAIAQEKWAEEKAQVGDMLRAHRLIFGRSHILEADLDGVLARSDDIAIKSSSGVGLIFRMAGAI